MAHDREVAGIRCTQVLAGLADYVDGALPPDVREQVEDHLRACDWCERFGGEYTGLVTTLRTELRAPPVDDGVERRLRAALGLP